MSPPTLSLGLDFGTTNSAIAVATDDGSARLASFPDGDRLTTTFRSVLYFDPEDVEPGGRPRAVAGPQAIRRYLEAGMRGRLIQSMKAHLASRLFKDTYIFGQRYTLDDLIAIIVRDLRAAAQEQFGAVSSTIVVGRPAHFASGRGEDDDEFALGRLRTAIQAAGWEHVVLELEPVAAAYEYGRRLDHDELALIGDFGGGTSDFCLVRLGPSLRQTRHGYGEILGVDGVGIAGDAFDSRVIRRLVAPELGLGSRLRSAFGQVLPVPAWLYERLEHWEHLSFLKTKKTMNKLQQIRFEAQEPEKIDALIHLVNDDLGYALYRAVERMKVELSGRETSELVFVDHPIDVRAAVARGDFESWIAPYLEAIRICVDRLLERCDIAASAVDAVFLTGGTSMVPAVRRLFEHRFGAARLRGGAELTTVASGLALRAAAG